MDQQANPNMLGGEGKVEGLAVPSELCLLPLGMENGFVLLYLLTQT